MREEQQPMNIPDHAYLHEHGIPHEHGHTHSPPRPGRW